jgi:hypothetical protein
MDRPKTKWRERHSAWIVTIAAAAILMVTMGARQSLGLFVSPLNSWTGLGITTISLAIGGFLLRKLLHGDKIVALGPRIIHLTGMPHE